MISAYFQWLSLHFFISSFLCSRVEHIFKFQQGSCITSLRNKFENIRKETENCSAEMIAMWQEHTHPKRQASSDADQPSKKLCLACSKFLAAARDVIAIGTVQQDCCTILWVHLKVCGR